VTFRTVPGDGPLPLVVVGAGVMGRAWLRAVLGDDSVRLAGLADVDVPLAGRVAAEIGVPGLPIGADAVALASQVGAAAVVDVTVPAAHHAVTAAALRAGLPVLGEKPAAATLAEAVSLAALAEATGELFMVSQSRRWNPRLFALRDLARSLGPVGAISTEFYRAPHFGGFREEMPEPLLVDMAIHPFDAARFVLADDPVAVWCESWNPEWSWYRGAASATALFTMTGGARYTYTGSWCARGAETSWNGTWRVTAAGGSVTWDGEGMPVPDPASAVPAAPEGREGIAAALGGFVTALRTGVPPMGEIHENLPSLAMVEAAVLSAREHRRVELAEVIAAANVS
jgi:predicted dehydrogenase